MQAHKVKYGTKAEELINSNLINKKIMKADLRIDQDDLKALFAHTRSAYGDMNFANWCKGCEKSYISYFNNKELFSIRKYTYSQFVNAQIIALY